jgi:hypothetical protein
MLIKARDFIRLRDFLSNYSPVSLPIDLPNPTSPLYTPELK